MGNFPAMYILLEIAEVCERLFQHRLFYALLSLGLNEESGLKFWFQLDWLDSKAEIKIA